MGVKDISNTGYFIHHSYSTTHSVPLISILFLYLIINPIVTALTKLRIPKIIGSLLTTFLLLSLISLSFSYLIQPATKWIQNSPENFRAIEKKFSAIKKPLQKLVVATEKAKDFTNMNDDKKPKVVVEKSEDTYSLFDLTSNVFVTVLTVFILLFFFLAYFDILISHIEKNFFYEVKTRTQNKFKNNIKNDVSNYIITFALICAFVGLVVGLICAFCGIPNPILWGVMAMLLNFIPYFGALIGIIIIFFVSMITFDTFWQILAPPLLYFLCTVLEGQIISPILIGHRLNLNPLVVFFSIILGGWMWGVSGILISVPFLVTIKVAFLYIPGLEKYSKVLET